MTILIILTRGYGHICLFLSQSVAGGERVNIFLGVPDVCPSPALFAALSKFLLAFRTLYTRALRRNGILHVFCRVNSNWLFVVRFRQLFPNWGAVNKYGQSTFTLLDNLIWTVRESQYEYLTNIRLHSAHAYSDEKILRIWELEVASWFYSRMYSIVGVNNPGAGLIESYAEGDNKRAHHNSKLNKLWGTQTYLIRVHCTTSDAKLLWALSQSCASCTRPGMSRQDRNTKVLITCETVTFDPQSYGQVISWRALNNG